MTEIMVLGFDEEGDVSPSCPTCAAAVPRTFTLDELARTPKHRKRAQMGELVHYKPDGLTHTPAGVEARYDLPKSEFIQCGFPDHTNHGVGCVIRTECGLILPIGCVCGSKRIPALKKLFKLVGELQIRESEREILGHEPAEVLAELVLHRELVEKVEAARSALKIHREFLFDCVAKHAATRGPTKGVVSAYVERTKQFLAPDGEHRQIKVKDEVRKTLVGLSFADPSVSVARYDEVLADLKRIVKTSGALPEVLSEVRAVHSNWVQIRKHVQRFIRKLNDAKAFFSDENLALLHYDLHHKAPPDGLIGGNALLLTLKNGETVRIGL